MIRNGLAGIALAAFLALPMAANAVPVVTLHSSNVGIGSMSYNVVGNTITIDEVWTSVAIGALEITGLENGANYTVVKNITNNTGLTWSSFANELLDPAGNPEDANDPQPYPGFVPAGFSTSSDQDGLSFAQGSGLPRTSVQFSGLLEDELSDARDFLDFFNGSVANGGTDTVTFGLRDNLGFPSDNQPFLLIQRPNAFSEPVPEPVTLGLLGTGLVALGWARRRRSV